MKLRQRRLLAAGFIATLAIISMSLSITVRADTPGDTLVVAKDISDIITLDPAEVFEFSGGELIANIYDRVMMYEPEDLSNLVGGVAESYVVSQDGKNVTLKIRPGQVFHSGNAVTAEDVAFSLQRVIKLAKTPVFLFTQLGWTPDNVDTLVKAVDDSTVSLTIEADLSPGLVLNALSAGVGSVVDKKLVMSHEKDGDLGYDWLKNHSAGSGAFVLKSWKANELVSLESNPNYRHGAPAMKRIILRHIAEPAAQRLLVEKGDVDIARNLTPDQIKGVLAAGKVTVKTAAKAGLIYLVSNDKHPILGKPEIRQALHYVIDYDGMANSFLQGQFSVHQAFWPAGFWGALEEKPFNLDLEKAKALISAAGHGDGFTVTLDTLKDSPYPDIAQAIQQNLSKVGIKAEIVLAEGKTLWPKYRARKHELLIARWSPDYGDPHSNADSFAHNPDNRDEAKLTGKLAWRTAWSNPEVTAMTDAAARELDLVKREKLYQDLQRRVQQEGPFSIMYQLNEQSVLQKNISGFVNGPNFDLVFYRNVKK